MKKRQEEIRELFILRRKAESLVERSRSTLKKREESLKQINEEICKIQGHTFTDWKIERIHGIDYYIRTCYICGKQEKTKNKPSNFESMMLMKKISYKKK